MSGIHKVSAAALTVRAKYGILIVYIGGDTHYKKRDVRHIRPRGVTPIQKNIRVIDEQGTEYETTYPKRAKGLVKNGRARFIDEHTICLARPPIHRLETKQMEQNQNLTEREIFLQIAQLQKQLTEDVMSSLHHLSDAISSLLDDGNLTLPEHVAEVCNVFAAREATFSEMLAFYRKLYDDIHNRDRQQVELIGVAFERLSTQVSGSDLQNEDKAAVFFEIEQHIAALTDKYLSGKFDGKQTE